MMIRKVIMSMFFLVVWVGSVCAGHLDITEFVGAWKIDFEQTMEFSKESPKYDEKLNDRMSQIIRRVMSLMAVQVNENDVIYFRGSREIALPYTVESVTSHSVTMVAYQEGEKIILIFTLIDKRYMNLKSSASDDMDYYVWKRDES